MTPSYDLVPGAQSFPDLKSVQMAESVIINHLREGISQMK